MDESLKKIYEINENKGNRLCFVFRGLLIVVGQNCPIHLRFVMEAYCQA